MITLERYKGIVFVVMLLYTSHHFLSCITWKLMQHHQMKVIGSSNMNLQSKWGKPCCVFNTEESQIYILITHMDVTNNSVHKQFFFFSFNDVKNTCNEFHSNNYLDEIVYSCHHLTPVLHSMKFGIILLWLFFYLVFDLCLNKIQFTIQSD